MFKIKFFVSVLLFAIFLSLTTSQVSAIYDPRDAQNNRMGVHIVDENDLNDSAKLLNSSGGDWGYVKLIITEDDRDIDKWQETFDRMRRLRLIPIVRIATRSESGAWVKPDISEIDEWVEFLSELNWVTENRYVVVFNEPNHAKEWGNELNPEEYASYLKEISIALKNKSSDFFILPAGLDASAPNSSETMDEVSFISRMVAKEPEIFDYIDGWSSHSYPNPGFAGSPDARGRGTVGNFLWEREMLRGYGKEELPIFVLETGWMHSEGQQFLSYYPTPKEVAELYKKAFSEIWNDENLVAIVPFILNYQTPPFDHFSWKKIGGSEFNEIFHVVSQLPKTKGTPRQKNEVRLISSSFPKEMIVGSSYTIDLELESVGQSIFSEQDGWEVSFGGTGGLKTSIEKIGRAEPYEKTQIELKVVTPDTAGEYSLPVVVKKDQEIVSESEVKFKLVLPPVVNATARTFPYRRASGNSYKFIVYDDKQKILFEKRNVRFGKGDAGIEGIHNIIPGRTYRFVLLHPYHLPRQVVVQAPHQETSVKFPILLPLDPTNDGALNLSDLAYLLRYPIKLIPNL